MRLSDKVSIITGAAAGLGAAAAVGFAHEGSHVVVADIDEFAGTTLVNRLRGERLEATFVYTDISHEDSVRTLIATVLARYDRIDVLYNNAAILLAEHDRHAHEIAMETWDRIMAVNLRGPFLCGKHAIPAMLRQKSGSIINAASRTGLFGCAPNLTAYSTSKAGVLGLTRVMAAAYASSNLRVNAIVPGTMETPMNRYLFADPAAREQYRSAVPLGRLGTGDDITGLAIFLASDESVYCTGGIYMCDGGATAV